MTKLSYRDKYVYDVITLTQQIKMFTVNYSQVRNQTEGQKAVISLTLICET